MAMLTTIPCTTIAAIEEGRYEEITSTLIAHGKEFQGTDWAERCHGAAAEMLTVEKLRAERNRDAEQTQVFREIREDLRPVC